MRTRNLLFYSIVYLVFLGLAVLFFFNDLLTTKHTVNIEILSYYSKSIELENAVWFAISIVVYMVFVLLYYYFSFLGTYLNKKRLQKDSAKFEAFLEDLVLERKSFYKFKTKEFEDASELIKALYYNQTGSTADKLANAMAIKAMIDSGKVCDLKPFKLNKDNSLNLKNEVNRAEQDLNYAYNIIRGKTDLTDEISLAAYENLIKNGVYANIKTLRIQKSKEDVQILLNRFINEDFSLTNAELEVLIFSTEFSEDEYLNIAKELFDKVEPISLKAIFEKLKNEKDKSLKAYLYILARHAMYDELMNELHSSEKKFDDFELLIFLKEHGKSYDVDKLIR